MHATPEPLDIQGLELPDGRLVVAPRPAVWGATPTHAQQRHAHARLHRLRREVGGASIAWDFARDAVRGVMVPAMPAPGAMTSPAAAEAIARAWLSRHIDILAPGSTPDDFVLVTNDRSAGMRSVGFAQHHDGVPVRGGQLSFRFKADALTFVGSQALPFVDPPMATRRIGSEAAVVQAKAWVAATYPDATINAHATGERLILPLWDGARFVYRDVIRVDVQSDAPLGRWSVYLDTETAEPVAREQRLMPAVTVRFNVPERHPLGARANRDAAQLYVVETGNPATTDLLGQVELTATPSNVVTTVRGPLVEISNAPAAEANNDFPVVDGDTIVWNGDGDEFTDSQLTTFIHVSQAKAFVRTIAPGLTWLDQTVNATVNIAGSCNAASDGDSLFFLQASGDCQNTGRLADVIHHELGHSVHRQSILAGVGAFDSALSEGTSDYLAATMVDDSGMGRGFFYNEDPLRELDPVGSEWTWPDDIGEVHETGRIIAGTLWDLRTTLMGTLGADVGRDYVDLIWYEATRRATDIPSMYAETLLLDDDDGDLNNGTPNGCEINAVFEAHGLVDPGTLGTSTIALSQVDEGRQVALSQAIPILPGCPTTLDAAELRWRLRGDPEDEFTTVAMTADGDEWLGIIPNQETGVVAEYQVALTYSNGASTLMPLNPADRWFQTFFGDVQPIYCLDDAADLGAWTLEGVGNNWSFGPLAPSGSDPSAPYDDDGVQLSQDGEYSPGSSTRAISPTIDISGRKDVRLHFRRWLAVEDAQFDHATLYANEQAQWANAASEVGGVHHVDRQWRFVDIDISEFIDEGDLRFGFELTSDQGLELGGWNVDSLCVVEVTDAVCGDNQVAGTEQCDDGNTEDGDGCDARCRLEDDGGSTGGDSDGGDSDGGTHGGDTVDGTGGEPPGGTAGLDTGETSSGDDTSGAQQGDDGGCSCRSGSSGGRSGSAAWLLLGLAGALRLRRRNQRQR